MSPTPQLSYKDMSLSEKFQTNLQRGHVSIFCLLIAGLIAAINTHGYTIISTILWFVNAGILVAIRYVSKTEEPPAHTSLFLGLGSLALIILPQFPPSYFMFWIGVFYTLSWMSLRFFSKLETKYEIKSNDE